MRHGHYDLLAVVRSLGTADPYSGHLFVFLGRRADRCKALFWNRGGFLVAYKRRERGRFRLPAIPSDAQSIDATALSMLLDSIHVKRAHRPELLPPRRCGDDSKLDRRAIQTLTHSRPGAQTRPTRRADCNATGDCPPANPRAHLNRHRGRRGFRSRSRRRPQPCRGTPRTHDAERGRKSEPAVPIQVSSGIRGNAVHFANRPSESYACPCPCPYAVSDRSPGKGTGHGHGYAPERSREVNGIGMSGRMQHRPLVDSAPN
jgi:transposase